VLQLPLDGVLVYHRIPSIKWLGLFLLSPGWNASPSQDTQLKVTKSFTTPPGWDTSPSQDTQLKVTRSITTLPEKDASPSQDIQRDANVPLDGILLHHRAPSME